MQPKKKLFIIIDSIMEFIMISNFKIFAAIKSQLKSWSYRIQNSTKIIDILKGSTFSKK